MTVFRNEQEGLRYSISSNNSAIKYFTQQLEEMPFYEFSGDFSTIGAIRAGYKEIIKLIKLDSKEMRKRIKELDSEDEENHN